MNKNHIGTYFPTATGYRLRHDSRLAGTVSKVRDSAGRFARKIPAMVITAMMIMIVALGVMQYINFHEIQALTHNLDNSKTQMRVYIAKSNKMVLDATLGQIAAIEKANMKADSNILDMVDASVGLTETLKDQIINKRKTDALK